MYICSYLYICLYVHIYTHICVSTYMPTNVHAHDVNRWWWGTQRSGRRAGGSCWTRWARAGCLQRQWCRRLWIWCKVWRAWALRNRFSVFRACSVFRILSRSVLLRFASLLDMSRFLSFVYSFLCFALLGCASLVAMSRCMYLGAFTRLVDTSRFLSSVFFFLVFACMRISCYLVSLHLSWCTVLCGVALRISCMPPPVSICINLFQSVSICINLYQSVWPHMHSRPVAGTHSASHTCSRTNPFTCSHFTCSRISSPHLAPLHPTPNTQRRCWSNGAQAEQQQSCDMQQTNEWCHISMRHVKHIYD